jgi:2-hydroxychromene-2-carboxylate isomerase
MTIRFLFDFVSPYAFLAWRQLRREGDLDVSPVPVLFAGLLNAHGQKGPAEIEAKRRYVFRDVSRKAEREGLTIAAPHTHPFNPLLALRVVCAADPSERSDVVDALFDATWTRGVPVTTPADLRPILGSAAERLLTSAVTPAVKDQLRAHTDEAIACGVFGVPTMLVGTELFWGTDSVDFAILASRGLLPPLPAERVAAWDKVTASASRLS